MAEDRSEGASLQTILVSVRDALNGQECALNFFKGSIEVLSQNISKLIPVGQPLEESSSPSSEKAYIDYDFSAQDKAESAQDQHGEFAPKTFLHSMNDNFLRTRPGKIVHRKQAAQFYDSVQISDAKGNFKEQFSYWTNYHFKVLTNAVIYNIRSKHFGRIGYGRETYWTNDEYGAVKLYQNCL